MQLDLKISNKQKIINFLLNIDIFPKIASSKQKSFYSSTMLGFSDGHLVKLKQTEVNEPKLSVLCLTFGCNYKTIGQY